MPNGSVESAPFGSPAEVVPGSNANTPNDDADQVGTAPKPAQGGVDTSDPSLASPSTIQSKKCACIVCLGVGVHDLINFGPEHCHFVGCNWTSQWSTTYLSTAYFRVKSYWQRGLMNDRAAHAKSHYQQGQGPEESQPFHCPVENCRYKSHRWPDLQRHTTHKHCKNPTKFECAVVGCRHHGEGNGFLRKDKLTAHYRSMHAGQRVPGQAARTLQPALASSHAEASGSGGSTSV